MIDLIITHDNKLSYMSVTGDTLKIGKYSIVKLYESLWIYEEDVRNGDWWMVDSNLFKSLEEAVKYCLEN